MGCETGLNMKSDVEREDKLRIEHIIRKKKSLPITTIKQVKNIGGNGLLITKRQLRLNLLMKILQKKKINGFSIF